ncbi:MAG: response regulator transcription factor [Bryobacterales bacterium]|nr:response regulator transcription factor [Bryobacterales bacterium]
MRILVAGKKRESREQTERILTTGFRVPACELMHARTANEVEETLRRQPNVVVCDRELEDCDWRSVLIRAKQTPDPPSFILIADREDPILWLELMENGGFDMLARPLSPDLLVRATATGGRRWLRRKEIHRERNLNQWTGQKPEVA